MKPSTSILVTILLAVSLVSGGFAFWYYGEVTRAQGQVQLYVFNPKNKTPAYPNQKFDQDYVDDNIVTVSVPSAMYEEHLYWALEATSVNKSSLFGLVLSTTLQPGDFLRARDFVDQPSDILARRIKDGNRAFSIPIAPDSAVANFLEPGSFVDVFLAVQKDDGSVGSELLLNKVELLAVDEYISAEAYVEDGRPTYRTLTVQAKIADVRNYLEQSATSRLPVFVALRCTGGGEDMPCNEP